MALNSENVLVALTGAVYVAPLGTALPTTTAATWDEDFVDLGYVSEDGVAYSPEDETAEIKAWQGGDVVRELIVSSKAQFTFTLLETTAMGLALYHRTAVVGTGTGPATVAIGSPTPQRYAWGIDVIDGTEVVRTTIASGEVSARGAITYKSADAISYELTVTAYPTAGVSARQIFSAVAGLPVTP